MDRTEKEQTIEELHKVFSDHPGVLLFGFSGITVPDVTDLRRQIGQGGNSYRVVKNRLAIRAARDTAVAPLSEHFRGPTAVAYSHEDIVGVAKAVRSFAKDHPGLEFKAGVLDNTVIIGDDLEKLAEMPSREQLLSKLAYLLQAPLSRFASALQSPLCNLASVLKQLSESKSE